MLNVMMPPVLGAIIIITVGSLRSHFQVFKSVLENYLQMLQSLSCTQKKKKSQLGCTCQNFDHRSSFQDNKAHRLLSHSPSKLSCRPQYLILPACARHPGNKLVIVKRGLFHHSPLQHCPKSFQAHEGDLFWRQIVHVLVVGWVFVLCRQVINILNALQPHLMLMSIQHLNSNALAES